MSHTHHLSLLDNSISYFREAVSYARRGSTDAAQWKFAVINLVQAMELALKESLRRIHPVFVYENIDAPVNSLSITKALQRLKNPKIGNSPISDDEQKNFEIAIRLRNELTHYEFSYTGEDAEAKFANLFAFMVFYYQQYLGLQLDQVIRVDEYSDILDLKRAKEALLAQAMKFIRESSFGEVWSCPECQEDTFVLENGQCCLCRHQESVSECPNCRHVILERELTDLSDLFDIDYSDGDVRLVNDFGYSSAQGCDNCKENVREDIQRQRFDRYCEDMAMEDY